MSQNRTGINRKAKMEKMGTFLSQETLSHNSLFNASLDKS